MEGVESYRREGNKFLQIFIVMTHTEFKNCENLRLQVKKVYLVIACLNCRCFLLDPIQHCCHSCIDSWIVRMGTLIAKRHHSNQGVAAID